MSENIVIVESPAKSKTLKKYLGKDFEIMASYGHVRDLIPREGAVDPNQDFAMHYDIIDKNKKHLDNIYKAVKKSKRLYLATDPDREGEAISWHIYEYLKEKGNILDKLEVYRVAFNSITKSAVLAAIDNPRELSQDLINAQQARRALDYLVGFNLSPLLWRKVQRGLSAGRVQSPALRMIVEREHAINAFKPEEYWTLEAHTKKDKQDILTKLYSYNKERIKQFSITTEKDANATKEAILNASNNKLTVTEIKKSQRKRNPTAPFITSTLQQEAARKLGFSTQKTMMVAQQLYEGVDFGEGATGLITYMRTDSVTLSPEAINDIRGYIEANYGKENLPENARVFKSKSKNAQEAHEAIRPTVVVINPEKIKNKVTQDQYKLYSLIWKRSIASQMIHATINQVTVDFNAGDIAVFRATGSSIANPGFMKVYMESFDNTKDAPTDEKFLPEFKKGEQLIINELKTIQHFTEPPPKFTEASLVKSLEEHGIGRPSTYASIISTLKNRKYVTIDNKRFTPTDIGEVVNKFLTNYFTKYVEYHFTAQLEDELDAVSRGEKEWVPLLKEFWDPFIDIVRDTQKNVKRSDVTHEKLDEKCPECGNDLSIRLGRNGKFIGCNGYPDCKYTRNLKEDSDEEGDSAPKDEIVEGRKCPECESDLIIRKGKYGKFIGCSGYPKCNFMEPLFKPEDTKVKCPQCNEGNLFKRKSRFGNFFYSCEKYPKCKYTVKHKPIEEKCPKCDWDVLTIKTTKKKGDEKVCPQKDCKFNEPLNNYFV